MIGLILLANAGCINPVTIKIPLTVYEINLNKNGALKGEMFLDYKRKKKSEIASWIKAPERIVGIENVPEEHLTCLPTYQWDSIVVPTLEKAQQQWKDFKD